ncbi:lysylphosphatidylglycerol synthase transmembrane domain-containing protein [Pseudomonas sp. UBA6310]|uniref:lysylphosphatidylglycerol synthase transmembrane domain-containing protein n=1 Tax=Pseudomonas sp. UBA6310 TaxID=1947327 RepID=UPI0025796A6D|nr:lysylphosphatidylglycerol synthase transmembrane domain-containing protein [Pseudomonas sp. UBA6310]
MSRSLWLLLGALLGAALVPLLLGGSGLFERLRTFPGGTLALMFAMILLCWNLNALRLRLLLGDHPIGHSQALGVVVATEFAICATPGGAGGPLTMMALLMRRGVRPAQGTAIYTVDQLSDLLVFVCALLGILAYALSHAFNAHVGWLLGSSAALLGGALLALALLGRYHHGALRGLGRLAGRVGIDARRRLHLARKLLAFRNALRASLRRPPRVLLGVFALTAAHWLLRYSVLYLTLAGLGNAIPWAWTFLVQMLALTAGQLSLLPGGAGGAELASAALLAPMVGKSTAGAAILIWRAVTYYFYLIAGAPVFLHLAGRPLLERLMRSRSS